MDTTTSPDSFQASSAFEDLACGLPADRAARLAARAAFVELKQLFLRATEPLPDRKGQWLREKVRLAQDPMDLWLLRGPVLAAQLGDGEAARAMRAELYHGIDRVFPQAFGSPRLQPRLPSMSLLWSRAQDLTEHARAR